MWYSNDMFHYMFKAEFVTLVSLKVPSGYSTDFSSSQILFVFPPPPRLFFGLGYLRDPHDRTRCRASEGRASLLFAHKTDIRRVALDRGGDLTSIVNDTRFAIRQLKGGKKQDLLREIEFVP